MSNIKKYSKLDIAVEHLDTAIKLFFEDISPISIQTLLGASDDLIYGILKNLKREDEHSREISKKANLDWNSKKPIEWIKYIKTPYDFSKHPAKDPEEDIEWCDTNNDFFIMNSISNIQTIDKNKLSNNMKLFIEFFKKFYTKYFEDEKWEPNDYMQNIDLVKRKNLKEYYKKIL